MRFTLDLYIIISHYYSLTILLSNNKSTIETGCPCITPVHRSTSSLFFFFAAVCVTHGFFVRLDDNSNMVIQTESGKNVTINGMDVLGEISVIDEALVGLNDHPLYEIR